MDINTIQQTKRLDKLVALLCDHPRPEVQFFGLHVAAHKRVVDRTYPTMATDSVRLWVNPDFMAERSDEHCLFVLIHEGFHRAALHSVRMRDLPMAARDLAHVAKDYAVNLALELDPGIPYRCPDEGLLDHKYKDDAGLALHAEEILRQLMSQPQPSAAQASGGSGDGDSQPKSEKTPSGGSQAASEDTSEDNSGDTDDAGDDETESNGGDDDATEEDTGSSISAEQSEGIEACGELLPAPDDEDGEELAETIASDNAAIESIIGAGNLPGHIREMVRESLTTAKTSWHDAVRAELAKELDKSDYNRRTPNKRYLHTGLIMPTLRNPAVGKIMVASDTSGSLNSAMLTESQEQLIAMLAEFSPREVLYVQHDTYIQHRETIHRGCKPLAVGHKGRGGTYFQPVLDVADAEDIDALLWLTDCAPCDTIEEPDYPVFFLNVAGSSGERWFERCLGFGRLITIE